MSYPTEWQRRAAEHMEHARRETLEQVARAFKLPPWVIDSAYPRPRTWVGRRLSSWWWAR